MSVKTPVKTKKPAVKKVTKEKVLKTPVSHEKEEVVTSPEEEIVADIMEDAELSDTEASGDDKNEKKEKYYQAVGRRKESIAIVRLSTKKSTDAIDGDYALLRVNDKDYRDYFTDKILQSIIESPLRKLKSLNRFKATVKVKGGGMSGQADAIKAGISRTLVLFDLNFRKKLKKSGFLTRDPRVKERRKYGLKKARKSPAWSKR